MKNMCIYLGKRDYKACCYRPDGKTCPSGMIRTCPCIPEDFWNIDSNAIRKEPTPEKIAEMKQEAKEETRQQTLHVCTEENDQVIRPVSIRNIQVFKSERK